MLLSRLHRFALCRRGAVAVTMAVASTALIGVVAFAVDLGKFYFDRRRAQSVTDLAALAAASNAANASLLANGTVDQNRIVLSSPLRVEVGTYAANPLVPAAGRLQVPATANANAVRVTLTTPSPLTFGRVLTGRTSLSITTTAVAARTSFAQIAIGSRLARLDGGVLNQLIGATIGGSVSLSVMDYQSLIDAKLDLFDVLGAAATRAHLTGPTYDTVLKADLRVGDVLNALVDTSRSTPATTASARSALAAIAGASRSTSTISLGSLFDLGSYSLLPVGEKPRNGVSLSAFDLVNAAARLADGQNQAAAALDLGIPGIVSASLSVALGERPVGSGWIAVGGEGATVRTAQTRLRFRVKVLSAGALASLDLPIYVDVAEGSASLDRIGCATGAGDSSSVTLGVRPGIVDAWIGDVSDTEFANTRQPLAPAYATIARALLLEVAGRAHVTASNNGPTAVTFSGREIGSGAPKTVGTTTILGSLTTSLLGDLNLRLTLAGIAVTLPLQQAAILNTLTPLAAPIDASLASILAFLGVGLGQADVWVNGVRCDGAVLVN